MAVALSEIIENARELHPSFHERHTPDPLCIRALTRAHEDLHSLTSDRNPEVTAAQTDISLPLADFAAGETLPEHYKVLSGHVYHDINTPQTRRQLDFVPWEHELFTRRPYAASIVGNTLFLVGTEADWNPFSLIRLRICLYPTAFTAVTDTITLPDYGHDAMIEFLGEFFAMRVPLADPERPNPLEFVKRRMDAVSKYLDIVGNKKKAYVGEVKEVW